MCNSIVNSQRLFCIIKLILMLFGKRKYLNCVPSYLLYIFLELVSLILMIPEESSQVTSAGLNIIKSKNYFH